MATQTLTSSVNRPLGRYARLKFEDELKAFILLNLVYTTFKETENFQRDWVQKKCEWLFFLCKNLELFQLTFISS